MSEYQSMIDFFVRDLSAATIVPSEQLFTGESLIYQPLCTHLQGDTVEKLVFIKYNLPELAFEF